MRCISPLTIRDERGNRNVVPCGKCNYCLQVKRADWSFRLLQEYKQATSAYFLTLTYSDVIDADGVVSVPTNLHKRDVQLFTKRLRKDNVYPLRYYTVGEYGTRTLRPHYHSIMFNLHPRMVPLLSDIWKQGHVDVGTVTPASIHYVTKYVINRTIDYGDRAPPFAVMSRRPGIGLNYLTTHKKWHLDQMRNYTQVNGIIGRLPRYYKEKIFEPWDREHLSRLAVSQSVELYREEIARLSGLHPIPDRYFDECDRAKHDGITSKINELNKF